MEEGGKNKYMKIVQDIELMLAHNALKFLERVDKELEENEINKSVRMTVVAEINNKQNSVLSNIFSAFRDAARKNVFLGAFGATEILSDRKIAENNLDDLMKMLEEAEGLRAKIHYCMRSVELGKVELEKLAGYFETLKQIESKNGADHKLKNF